MTERKSDLINGFWSVSGKHKGPPAWVARERYEDSNRTQHACAPYMEFSWVAMQSRVVKYLVWGYK